MSAGCLTLTSSGAAAVADFSRRFTEVSEWLQDLLQLVDCSVDFSALKFSNYLEAEMQLFRRMPQLRAVCKEARRLYRADPKLSPDIASRVGLLQATWLAVESRLAQFKTKKALLTALSGDLKQLKTKECDNQPDSDYCTPGKHICCTRRIELLDGAIQKKESQLQQMLSVTAAISRLIDWLCASDFLGSTDQQHSRSTTATVSANSPAAVVSSPVEDSIAATAAAAAAAEAATPTQDAQSISLTGSTTYVRTVTNTDGDQADLICSESSEIIMQTGAESSLPQYARPISRFISHNSIQTGTATTALNSRYVARRGHARSIPSSRQSWTSSTSGTTTGSEQMLEIGIESARAAAAAQRDNHNALTSYSCSDTELNSIGLCQAEESADDATAAATEGDIFSLPRDRVTTNIATGTATSGLSPLLQTVCSRVAALKASVEIVQARLLHSGAPEDCEARTSQLGLVETGLSDWQSELARLKARVLDMSAASAEEAVFQRAYLESIALLTNWTGSLRDRCRSRLLELRRTQQQQLLAD